MASVVLTPTGEPGKTRRFTARFDRSGADLPRRPQFTSSEMLDVQPGPEAAYPVGTDTRTPGFPNSRRRNPGTVVYRDRD